MKDVEWSSGRRRETQFFPFFPPHCFPSPLSPCLLFPLSFGPLTRALVLCASFLSLSTPPTTMLKVFAGSALLCVSVPFNLFPLTRFLNGISAALARRSSTSLCRCRRRRLLFLRQAGRGPMWSYIYRTPPAGLRRRCAHQRFRRVVRGDFTGDESRSRTKKV